MNNKNHSTLGNCEAELKKHSIYLLNDDSHTRNFEFFIFDDSGENTRPEFLKELFQIIKRPESFAISNHKDSLEKWLNNRNSKIKARDKDLIPLNWIKIAIENYPYRLFVVTDNQIDVSKLPPFIKKRICFLNQSLLKSFRESFRKNKKKCQRAIISKMKEAVYFEYLKHIIIRILGEEEKNLLIRFNEKEERYKPYFAGTEPGIFKPVVYEHPNGTENHKFFEISFKKDEIKQVNNEIRDDYILYSSRHTGYIGYNNGSWSAERESNLPIYSEAYSGSMTFISQLYRACQSIKDFTSRWFFLRYAEQALIRIGICDDRFQEWWAKMPEESQGNIFQSKLTPVYLEDERIYHQAGFPTNGKFYSVLKLGNEVSIEFHDLNDNGAIHLWSGGNYGLDLLIIHQTILEHYAKAKGIGDLGNINREILKIKDKIPFVVVTSGRGKPENLPLGVKFLGYSNIQGCLVGNYIEKLTLVRQIMGIK
ncbi:MAG TPA: hypothetical protein PLN24_09225 [Victivallales bacterium]|nr:hypothetical protein [Victivallales bacterium]